MTRRRTIHAAFAASAALWLALPGCAHAGTARTANAEARVLDTIQVAVLRDMNFGRVALRRSADGGTIAIDPASAARNCDSTLVCAGTFATSQLELTGSDADLQVTFEPTFKLTGPGDPIAGELRFSGRSGTIVRIVGGSTVIRLGARLAINPHQAPGVYSGRFSINLEYY